MISFLSLIVVVGVGYGVSCIVVLVQVSSHMLCTVLSMRSVERKKRIDMNLLIPRIYT